tara:strand:- start:151 stop:342 length:192 start_codon:yes stop_codon:yes gene_type:complete
MNKTENKLTLKEIIHIIDNRLLHKCTKEERKQIMDFAFGDDYRYDQKTIRQRIKEKYDKNERP